MKIIKQLNQICVFRGLSKIKMFKWHFQRYLFHVSWSFILSFIKGGRECWLESSVVRTQWCWQSWEINIAEDLWKRGRSHVLFLGREVLSKTIIETCRYLCKTSKFQQNCYTLNNGRFRLCQNAAGQICYIPIWKATVQASYIIITLLLSKT